MKFIDTKRFSPVIWGKDLPHSDDMFHYDYTEIPSKVVDRKKFIKENNIFTDTEWWSKQYYRCMHGYTVENAIEPGGDAMVDGVDAFWKGNTCYIPQYDLFFIDRKVHISGRYYFYLNFWPIYGVIQGKDYKGIIRPRFLDHQFYYSRRSEMMREQKKDGSEFKTRQLGVSELEAGLELAYNYLFLPASINIIVAGEQGDADHTFENCDRGLEMMINTQFYLERAIGGNNKSLIKSKYNKSEIRALTAKDKPQTLSRFSPTYVLYEEIGKGKKDWSLQVSAFVRASIFTNNKKTGYQKFVATGGNMEEGAHDIEVRHFDPKEHDILEFNNIFEEDRIEGGKKVGHFMGKYWFKIIDDDGNTQKQESIKALLAERKNIKPSELYIHVTQNAIYASEALMISTIGYFGSDRISALNRRRIEIKQNSHLQLEKRCILKYKDSGKKWLGVEIEYKEDGWLNIIEEPIKDKEGKVYVNLYHAGTDSYDQDEAYTSSSKGAMYVKKGYLPGQAHINCCVAELIERPTIAQGGAETFFEHTIMVCLLYRCQNNIEYSNIRIFYYYRDHNFEHLLKERPRLAFANKLVDSSLSNPWGTDKTLKPQILAILADSLTDEAIANMFFLNQITSFSRFKYNPGEKFNCDITIASAETEVSFKEDLEIVVKSEKEMNSNKPARLIYKTNSRGQLVQQFL